MKVFISHSGIDRWAARQLANLIEASGHTTFLDEKDISTGDPIDASIQQHLKECQHLLLLLSPASIASHWVLIELGGAKALGKKVIPILFHLGANEIPPAISQLLARDINDFDKYLEELQHEQASKSAPAKIKTEATVTASRTSPKEESKTRKKPGEFELHHSQGDLSKGDRVRILQVELLTDEDKEESPKWVRGMNKYSGLVTRIVGFATERDWAVIEVDGGDYWWLSSWLSKVD